MFARSLSAEPSLVGTYLARGTRIIFPRRPRDLQIFPWWARRCLCLALVCVRAGVEGVARAVDTIVILCSVARVRCAYRCSRSALGPFVEATQFTVEKLFELPGCALDAHKFVGLSNNEEGMRVCRGAIDPFSGTCQYSYLRVLLASKHALSLFLVFF